MTVIAIGECFRSDIAVPGLLDIGVHLSPNSDLCESACLLLIRSRRLRRSAEVYQPEKRGLLELAHDAIARCRAEATTNHRTGFVRALYR
jgi:hypothetical protein